MSLYWPVLLVVLSNVFYNICAKSTPNNLNPFAGLTVTYLVAAVASAIAFFTLSPSGNLVQEYKHLNWSTFVMGLAAVGLEAGFIYLYKVGWNISTGQLVTSSLLAVCLIVIGYFFYNEAISVTKVIGILVCLVGLFLINNSET